MHFDFQVFKQVLTDDALYVFVLLAVLNGAYLLHRIFRGSEVKDNKPFNADDF